MTGNFNITYTAAGPDTAMPARDAVVPQVAASPLSATELFPTRIWQARLAALQPHFARWTRAVLALRAANPRPAGRTVRAGWNSEDMRVLEQPDFAPLRQAIRAACQMVLVEMGQGAQPFGLQSWINLHDRGGFNYLHAHENALLSGSFYLQVPSGSGDFVFRDPRPGVIHNCVKGEVPNGHTDVHLRPGAGLLVLFPCWLEHYVEVHEGDEPRITIAFNANAPEAAQDGA